MPTNTIKTQQQQPISTPQTTSQRRRAAMALVHQQNQSPKGSDHQQSSGTQKSTSTQQISTTTPQKSQLTLRPRGDMSNNKNQQTNKNLESQNHAQDRGSLEIFCEKSTLVDNDSHQNQHSNSKSIDNQQPQIHSLLSTEAVAAFQKQQSNLPYSFSPMRHKHSMGMDSFGQFGEGPSSVATLQPHPFNVLISDFQQRRSISNLKKQANINEFLTAFKSQIKDLDNQYYQQKQQIREQMVMASKSESCLQQQSQVQSNDQIFNKQSNESSSDHYLNLPSSMQNLGILGQLGLCPNQTPTNHIPIINEPYESFEFVPNSLQFYYPKQVQRQLQKKKFQNTERIVSGLKPPSNKASFQKNLEKMRALTNCQMHFISVVFQKIHRKSKPIKKQEKLVSENLKRKRIFLEEENFDIINVLQSSQSQAQKVSADQNAKIQQQQINTSNNNNNGGMSGFPLIMNQQNNHHQQYQLSVHNQNENSLSNLSELDSRNNGQLDSHVQGQQQISINHNNENANQQKNTKQIPSKTPINTHKNHIETPSKKLALQKSRSVGMPNSNAQSDHYNAQNIIDTHHNAHHNPTTIIIDPSVLQTPSKNNKNNGNSSNTNNQRKLSQSKKTISQRKIKPLQGVPQNTYVQAYEKENGSLYMKIILPENANNNSNSIDKHTEEDDQNQAMIDHYDQQMMNQDELIDAQMHQNHQQLIIQGHQLHHQHYLFGQQEVDDEHTVPHQKAPQIQGFSQYLEIEHSHSEPPRFGVAHGVLPGRNLGVVNGHHHVQSDIVMGTDDRIFMDSYHHRNPFISSNPPGSASTQITSDLHHDILINRLKPNCARNIDYFGFDNDMQAQNLYNLDSRDQNEMFYEYTHNRITDIQNSSGGLNLKEHKTPPFYMGSSSPDPQNHLIGGFEPQIFRDDFIAGEGLSEWHNPLVNDNGHPNQIIPHPSHEDSQFNYDMRM